MNLPAHLYEPKVMSVPQFDQHFYQFPSRLIREYGDYLYMLRVYASVPLIGWILSDGLRRKRRHPEPGGLPMIIAMLGQPAEQFPVPPPIIGREFPPRHGDQRDGFAT